MVKLMFLTQMEFVYKEMDVKGIFVNYNESESSHFCWVKNLDKNVNKYSMCYN